MAIDIKATVTTCRMLADQINDYVEKKSVNLKNNVNMDSTSAVKISDVPSELTEALSRNFLMLLEFVNSYLLTDSKAMFYSSVLISLKYNINYSQRGLIDIVFKDPVEMTFNPLFIGNMTMPELLTMVMNEIMKFVFMHPDYYAKYNGDKNDKRIHDRLEKSSSVHSTEIISRDLPLMDETRRLIKIPRGVYTANDLENDIQRSRQLNESSSHVKSNEAFKYYFDATNLIKDNKNQGNGSGNGSGGGENNQQGNSQQNQNNDQNDGSGGGSSDGVATPNNNNGTNIHNWENNSQEDIKEKTKDVINNALSSMTEKQKGDIPANIQELIKKLFEKPKLNWKTILKKFVGLVPQGHRKTKVRPNRRLPERFDLSGVLADTVVRIVVAIDTSGSMSEKDIRYCFNEIFNILKMKKFTLEIIECDAEIGRIYTAKKMSDIDLKVTGRGGTSFIPVINYLNSHKYKDALLIYFTDGYGDYEIPKPKTYRNLWVVVGGPESQLSLKNPYGEVRALKDDEDYRNQL